MVFLRPFADGRSHVARSVSVGHRLILPSKTAFEVTKSAGLLRMMEELSKSILGNR